MYLDKTEKIDSRTILSNFLIHKNLYESISDVMQCIVTCFFFGHNECYVESIGSVLKHHYPPNRNVTLAHLEDEVVVAWNGPPIPHADRLIKATIDRIQGIGAWHFHRISETSRLKFYRVSEAVDNLAEKDKCKFALDSF